MTLPIPVLWVLIAFGSVVLGTILGVVDGLLVAPGDSSLYAVGATIGVVLAGFNSQNRSVFRTERDSSVMSDPDGIGAEYIKGLQAFKSSTTAALILLAVSVLSLSFNIGEEKANTIVWLVAFFQAVFWFSVVEFHVDKFTRELVKNKEEN